MLEKIYHVDFMDGQLQVSSLVDRNKDEISEEEKQFIAHIENYTSKDNDPFVLPLPF